MRSVSISWLFLVAVTAVQGFVSKPSSPFVGCRATVSTRLFATTEEKAAPMVTGEELEKMLTEWDEPLVIDAYATW
jgi:hypothetical protein